MDKPLHVLVSAYACGPNWGSEIGMGWNWVIHLAQYCELTVITENGFKDDIEKVIPKFDLKYIPKFHYIDIGIEGRKLFWKQGSFNFYYYYKKWQKEAYQLSLGLIKEQRFDIIHQLNMIGFREPGYLWKIKEIPYIIGPVGGYAQFPKRYYSLLNKRDVLFYLARSIINNLQIKLLTRPKHAYKNAARVLAATPNGLNDIAKHSKLPPIIITETGAGTNIEKQNKHSYSNRLNFVWVGIIKGSKALPIALKAIAKSKYKEKIQINIVGDGPNLGQSIKLVEKLQLQNVTWSGRIPNVESKKIIANSDMLFFSSLLEATSTVIFESLEAGTPVLCHDSFGFGNVIDNTCGLKIPMISPNESIEMFSKKIDFIFENPSILDSLKDGCYAKIKQYSWDSKAEQVFKIYKECMLCDRS